jgi:hypothetical protein
VRIDRRQSACFLRWAREGLEATNGRSIDLTRGVLSITQLLLSPSDGPRRNSSSCADAEAARKPPEHPQKPAYTIATWTMAGTNLLEVLRRPDDGCFWPT